MSAELSVVLDKPYDYYTAGDKVTGHVLIHADRTRTLRKLQVAQLWRERGGEDDGHDHPAAVLKVSDKKLAGGRDHRFRFEFTAERTPVTHRGSLVDVSWLVHADARFAGDDRARAEAEYIQLAGKRESHKKGKPLMAGETKLGRVGNVLFRRMCRARASLRPNKVWPGQTAVCVIELRPTSEILVNAVTATLVSVETTVTGKRKSPSVNRNRVAVRDHAFPSATGSFGPGDVLELDCLFTVPGNAEPSASTKRKKMEWLVELDVDVARWPDLKEGFPLIVLPT